MSEIHSTVQNAMIIYSFKNIPSTDKAVCYIANVPPYLIISVLFVSIFACAAEIPIIS